jgi:hypothetical protein
MIETPLRRLDTTTAAGCWLALSLGDAPGLQPLLPGLLRPQEQPPVA